MVDILRGRTGDDNMKRDAQDRMNYEVEKLKIMLIPVYRQFYSDCRCLFLTNFCPLVYV